MGGLIERISSYNILNCLLPGALFAVFVDATTDYHLVQEDIVTGLFVYYFIGLVIGRVGSLIVEPVLKGVGFIRFADYRSFVEVSKTDRKIDTLSETNNMFRTLCALLLVLLCAALLDWLGFSPRWGEGAPLIICGALLIVFLLAYRKQTGFIRSRVEKANEPESQGDG